MTQTEQTKEVQSYFGTKQISRAEFVQQWESQIAQVFSLTETTAEFNEIKAMKNRIGELAGKRWDNLK